MFKYLLAAVLLVGSAFGVTCPVGGVTTPNYDLCEPPHGQPLWDFYYNADLSTIDAAIAAATSGSITASSPLTLNQIVIGQGSKAVATLGSLGSTTTVLHGNASGPPSFSAVSLVNDVTGQLAIAAVGSGGLSGTGPISIASTGAISCTTCTTGSSFTLNQLLFGAGSQGIAVGDLTGDIITFGAKATSLAAKFRVRGIPFTIGTFGGSAITAGANATDLFTVPIACTISAYNLVIDTGTITVKFWKVATGTAIPTSSNSISTSGVGIATGTAIHSAVVTDFTTTTVSVNDIMAMNVTASTAGYVQGVLECDQ